MLLAGEGRCPKAWPIGKGKARPLGHPNPDPLLLLLWELFLSGDLELPTSHSLGKAELWGNLRKPLFFP